MNIARGTLRLAQGRAEAPPTSFAIVSIDAESKDIMKAFVDCIPCAVRQALRAARIASDDERDHRAVVTRVTRELASVDPNATPMELGQIAQRAACELTGCADPYVAIKKQSNEEAWQLYPRLKEMVRAADDPLCTATKIATAGNVIDFGTPYHIDVEETLGRAMTSEFGVDDYELFAERLADAARVLYLTDNAGEIVFDRVLIEELPTEQVVVAVKDKPFINDALLADAVAVGLTELVKVIEVPLYPDRSRQFDDTWAWADLIVAKGQANYEVYSEAEGLIFFLLLAKCDSVAEDAGVRVGDMILLAHNCRKVP